MELKEIRLFLDKLKQDDVSFDSHFYKRTRERPIHERIVRSFLFHLNKLEKIEKAKEENRFKLWFKMSRKYSLVLIIEISLSKHLKIISAWNTNRKWQNNINAGTIFVDGRESCDRIQKQGNTK